MSIKLVCALSLISVLLLFPSPSPSLADGGPLQWGQIEKPGTSGNIIVGSSEVSDIAVGSRGTIYAVNSANATSSIYQSFNGGSTWEDITSRLVTAGAVLPADKVALAPDTTSIVAVVTNSGTKVYLSTDSGATWTDTAVPGLTGTIQSIAISRQYTESDQSLREIAIGTAVWGNTTTTGQLLVRQVGKFVSSWQDQSLTVDPGFGGGEVAAIAYSPRYQQDNSILVVAATGSDAGMAAGYRNKTWLCLGKRDTAAGTTSWDTFSGYPVEVATASAPSAGDAAGVSISASLALPSDYSSTDEDLRQLFVSYDRTPADASDDVFRFEDTSVFRLNASGGAVVNISTLAYSGTIASGKLLAGDVSPVAGATTTRVRRTANPFSSSPTWYLASVPPSGSGNARVAWSPEGAFAYCGTGQSPTVARDESAFSMSSDDGGNWQQLSLMDTTLRISDIAAAPNSDTLFVTSYSTFGPEGIWRSTHTQYGIGEYWSRQLTMNTASNRVILRASPDYASDYTIYAAEAGGNLLAVSHNRGNTWKQNIAPDGVIDLVVADENTLYAALPGGNVRKSTNGGFIWGEPVATGLSAINMLATAGNGTVLVGGRNGEVAYSEDGGASFTRINKPVAAGDVQVVADAGYQKNGIIYAATNATDKGIWRWTVGVSSAWEQIDESVTALSTGQRIGGLAMSAEGTLYALRLESSASDRGGMTRSLNPAAGNVAEIEFAFTNGALPSGTSFDSAAVFPNTLPALKLSGDAGQTDLWALDTANGIIYRFQDTLSGAVALPAVSVLSPADQFSDPVNPVTGEAQEILFSWSRLSSATDYRLEIARNPGFTELEATVNVSSSLPTVSVAVGPERTGAQQFSWSPGMTYYWRVAATAPLYSAYSAPRTIITGTVPAQVPVLLSPVNGATSISPTPSFSWRPISGVNEYRFVLSDNVTLANPVIDVKVGGTGYALNKELQFAQTYYWAVKAAVPVEGDWSPVANFTVKEKPSEQAPPVLVQEVPPPVINLPAPVLPPEIVIPPPPPSPEPVAPAYVWALIGIGVFLVITVIFLIVRMR